MEDLRGLASATESGQFRPLKSAPNLVCGWRMSVGGADALGQAIDRIYPGAIPDWFASLKEPIPVTHFREFVVRQTGMYRLAQKLDDRQAALSIRACCAAASCLKRRFWTVQGLDSEGPESKSMIPCLEPCAVFLEFARRSMRIEQQERVTLSVAPDDLTTIRAVLAAALEAGLVSEREGDVSDPRNPRRIRRALELIEPSDGKASAE